ncbi:septal ring lytic transglycosylase RlpA family protein [Sandaracinobacter neustonicus]|uniref:Endolytic peptidoglycan transglycosylase RlpA n=1 Tax=Sandaracinobacter neustonicus TaxID=1715348 RepID=A0A501XSQ1_9SPHN|nr:septal ring lytic transglycosylase RlpA family protein [Sandaracinobacter neustonicus]TPE63600.1 septal ring lytic transglycosylase RlpA family protein [Sandaracinobacter neustonicus]
MRFSPLSVSSLLLLAACASQPKPPVTASKPLPKPTPHVPAGPAVQGVKVGKPYQVFGVTYYPADDRGYDKQGIASWYGPTFHEKATANGETYNQDDITAAHKTLPMPSWVEVTNLDNGRVLVVRINDRGPFVDGRIIDLSRKSAQLLGVDGPGLAKVRVKRVFPEGDWARGAPVLASAPAQNKPALAPAPAAVPAPLAAPPVVVAAAPAGGRYIQVAALSDEARARALASVLGDFGPAFAAPSGTGMWRVRIGPLADVAAADLLEDVRAAGYPQARVVTP